MTVDKHPIAKYFPTLVFFVFFSNYSIGQTGPGGVGNATNNIVWLDAHALNFSDGTPIAIWDDHSGNSNNFNQAASSQRPLYNSAGIGGVPSLTFDGFNDIMESGAISALESANVTYFVVYDRTTTSSDMIITANYTSNFKKWRTYMNNGQNTILSAHYSPSIKWVRYTDPPGSSFFSTHITPAQIRTFNQGNLEMSRSATYTVPTGHNNLYIGNRDPLTESNYTFTGEIAEVVVYNSALNNLERIMVENYLGAKYNLAIPTDHYSYQATHKFGLIGLGNDGVDIISTAQGAGVLEVSSAAGIDPGEYFVVAHTDFDLEQFNSDDIPASLPEHQRFERSWKLDETGDVGITTLTFRLGLNDFATSDSYRLLVDTDDVFADATIVMGTYDAGNVSFDINLADGEYFTLVGFQEQLEIHSIINGDWSSTSTWDCSCIPSINDIVFIDPSTTVNIETEALATELTVESGGTLEMSIDASLALKEDWTINGEVNFTAGKVSLIGSESQTVSISPGSGLTTVLNDLIIENASTGDVTFENGTFSLHGLFAPNLGNIVIDPSTEFIIASTSPTEGGRIGPIVSSTNITGNFSVQRFIPPGVADWRDLCSPVLGSTFDDWDPDLAMSGPGFPDGCATGPDDPCFKSVRYTDHSISVNVLNSYEPITNARGFQLFVGSDLETFDGTTLTSTGPINSPADIIETYSTGWTTIGNPYASPIAYNAVIKSSSISKYYYVYDAAAGVYQWYDELSGTSSVPEITSNGLIATGQAVWIFATSAGNITFQQNSKSFENATFFRNTGVVNEALQIQLIHETSNYTCSMEIQEASGANDDYDELSDIVHLSTGQEKGPALTMLCSNQLIRKNFINDNGANKAFELTTHFKEAGQHTISASNWANFRDYDFIYLVDNMTGETINLKAANYTFNVDLDNTNPRRFTLLLENANNSAVSNLENGIDIKQVGQTLVINNLSSDQQEVDILISNIIGQKELNLENTLLTPGKNQIMLPSSLSGIQLITIQTANKLFTKKIYL